MSAGDDYESFVDSVFTKFGDRWPTLGDQLFHPDRDMFVAQNLRERRFRLLLGYKRAGDLLIANASTDRSDRFNVIFPALFNYRHYIELALKTLIETHGDYAGVTLGTLNHGLPELWKIFQSVAAAFGSDCADDAFVAVGSCIDEMARLDMRSTAFRYAADLKGQTQQLPESIDLIRLHDVMNGIQNFFECADLDFHHQSGTL